MPFTFLARFLFHLRYDGLKNALQQVFFVNKSIIIVTKKIGEKYELKNKNIKFITVDKHNYKILCKKYSLHAIQYYAIKHANCLIALKNKRPIGHIWWIKNSEQKKLSKLGLKIGDDEAYLFGLFVLPEHRGTYITNLIVFEVLNNLFDKGVKRCFGFYVSHNVRAMWFHNTMLKSKEIKRLKMHRFFLFEIIDGKLMIS
jgi:hypothetical protein